MTTEKKKGCPSCGVMPGFRHYRSCENNEPFNDSPYEGDNDERLEQGELRPDTE